MKQRARTMDHTVWLQRHLKDPKEAIAYLREFLRDEGEGNHWPLLLEAVRNVAAAHATDSERASSSTPNLADWVSYAIGLTGVADAAKGR